MYWFGLTDVVVEGTWDWIDGTSLDRTNWGDGEPNQKMITDIYPNGNVDCGVVFQNKWYDSKCSYVVQSLSPFTVCEANGPSSKDLIALSTPHDTDTPSTNRATNVKIGTTDWSYISLSTTRSPHYTVEIASTELSYGPHQSTPHIAYTSEEQTTKKDATTESETTIGNLEITEESFFSKSLEMDEKFPPDIGKFSGEVCLNKNCLCRLLHYYILNWYILPSKFIRNVKIMVIYIFIM